ncbi:hypothetical protein DC3_02440 [Deinococcus cellulosilyticus NBRC 106333 = KACC 11606]|uniref:Uncharacterized protein n=1 Tax=Deinococcus cellulosilyticus (strain DSM 18568 / NBRC 106333 / KACC 11606 / 5516J-15) TaxID=1223518 RepID=A0A511MVJ6_DEIC1|nr:hypothetical protein DC3_02440 [Deinococcus cellulosilyticus NBRC 106333 = KACC 11606]
MGTPVEAGMGCWRMTHFKKSGLTAFLIESKTKLRLLSPEGQKEMSFAFHTF